MKVLKIAAIVVGVAALALTTGGIALGGLAAGASTAAAGTAAALGASLITIGTIASVAAAVLSLGVSLLSKPSFSSGGNPLTFQTNPQSGLPYGIGRTRMSGLKIDGVTGNTPGYSDALDLLFFGVMLSVAGPVQAIESFNADNIPITFNVSTGNSTTGGYVDWMAQKVALGASPQPAALTLSMNGAAYPGWTSAHKLSGVAHALWGLRFDAKGAHYQAGLPNPSWIGRWVKVYDPRKDSTYPGGSGTHRAAVESTYEWSRNPGLHALTWALGRWQNGKKICGIGAPVANIRVADFVEMANVCDANNWGIGGIEWTTEAKWDVFRRMLQAGGAVPTMPGAMIGCRVRTPRVSLGTITADDLLDELVWPATKPRRERFNTVLPRYVSEYHDWQVITGSVITVPTYVTADGGARTKGIDFPLVQAEIAQGSFNGDLQVGQLSAYEVVDSREAGPITFATGPKWLGLRSGDCVVIDAPDEGIASQKVLITSVSRDPASGIIRFTAETETDSKHAFALGKTTVPPAAPTLTVPAGKPSIPSLSNWIAEPISLADGQPGIRIVGTITDPIADRIIIQYRVHGGADWISVGSLSGSGVLIGNIGPIDGDQVWDVRLAYAAGERQGDWLEIPSITTDANTILSLIASGAKTVTAFPAATDSSEGQIYIRTDLGNRLFIRIAGDGNVAILGSNVTIGGNPIYLPPYAEITDQRVIQAMVDAANAQALATIAQGLALDAQATADGKVRTFYQASPPVAEGVGDLWFDTDDGRKQYRWDGASWQPAQDQAIGNAISAAAGAQATADGKVTTFVSGPAAPTAEGIGDLWLYGGVVKRWNGATWGPFELSGDGILPDTITAENLKPDEGVDIDVLVPGTTGSRSDASTNYGGSLTAAPGASATSAMIPIGSTNITTYHYIRAKLTVNARQVVLDPGNPSGAQLTLYIRINGGSWVSTGLIATVSTSTNAFFSTAVADNIDNELKSTWTGVADFAFQVTANGGGGPAGAISNAASVRLDLTVRK
jgi:hypothetical protein